MFEGHRADAQVLDEIGQELGLTAKCLVPQETCCQKVPRVDDQIALGDRRMEDRVEAVQKGRARLALAGKGCNRPATVRTHGEVKVVVGASAWA